MDQKLPGRMRSFTRHEVYAVVVLEGAGVEGNPHREVTYWFFADGRLLLREDPLPEQA